jgi:hypothetical protein
MHVETQDESENERKTNFQLDDIRRHEFYLMCAFIRCDASGANPFCATTLRSNKRWWDVFQSNPFRVAHAATLVRIARQFLSMDGLV